MSQRQEGVEQNYFKLAAAECGRQRIRCLHLGCGPATDSPGLWQSLLSQASGFFLAQSGKGTRWYLKFLPALTF